MAGGGVGGARPSARLLQLVHCPVPAGSPGYVARWRRERAPAVAIFRRRPIDRTRARQASPPPPVLPGARAPLWFFFPSSLFALPLLGRVAYRGGPQLRGPGPGGKGRRWGRQGAARGGGGHRGVRADDDGHAARRPLSRCSCRRFSRSTLRLALSPAAAAAAAAAGAATVRVCIQYTHARAGIAAATPHSTILSADSEKGERGGRQRRRGEKNL